MLKKCHSNLCEGIIRHGFGLKYGKHRSGRSRPKILCVLRLLLLGSLAEFCSGEYRHNSSCLSEWRLPLHALP